MVVLNKNAEEFILPSDRYVEGLSGFTTAKNVLTGETIPDLNRITIPAMSPLILELNK